MKILYLPLKKEWYEMIERGDKREEYRENTRYWKTRLIDTVIYDEGDEETESPVFIFFKDYDAVCFSYGYTEQMAKQLCATHGLLSPIYTTGTRGGCWFCPNCKIQHFVNLRRNHPELWAELVELSHTPNLCSYGFKYGLTVQEVEKRMNAEEQQLKLF